MKSLIIVILGFIGVVAMPCIIKFIGGVPGTIVGVILSLIIMIFMFTKEVE